MKIVCVVLAGGEGRRMGGRKPLQAYGDATLIAQALRLAHGYAEEVAVALRDPGQAGSLDAPSIQDDATIEGPLGGLEAALAHAQAHGLEAVLTIPCDAPHLPDDLAARLAEALRNAPDAVAAVAQSGERLHPVCALWRAGARHRLARYLETGARSLRGFAEACDAVTVEWPADPVDPFANANTPEELAALQPDRSR